MHVYRYNSCAQTLPAVAAGIAGAATMNPALLALSYV